MNFNEWQPIKLGDVVDISSSKRIFAKEYVTKGIPFYRGKEIIEKSKGNKVSNELFISEERYTEIKDKFGVPKDGDILLTSVGTLGTPYLVQDEEFYFKDGNLTWFKSFSQKCDNKFIYLWLQSDFCKSQIYAKAIGSTQKALTIEMLKKFDLLLPPLNEQKAIANILSSLDDKIELNNQMNETLEEMAQTLFKRWFVDFEYPNEEGQPYKSSGGEMVESELGLIPKGWNSGTLSNICEYRKDKVSTAQINLENYISTENMISNKAGITVATGLPSVDKVNKFEPKNILVSNIRPYFKKIYFADIEGGCSNDVLCFKTHKEEYAIFLFLTLFEDKFFDYMMAGAKGTKMPRGDKNQIMKYIITIAPSNVYINFNNLILPILTKISEHKKQNKILIELRDSLLPKLMSGEIRVRDLEN